MSRPREDVAYDRARRRLSGERHGGDTPVQTGDLMRLDGPHRRSYSEPPTGDVIRVDTVTQLSDLDRNLHAGPWARYHKLARKWDRPEGWWVVEAVYLTGDHAGSMCRLTAPRAKMHAWHAAHDEDHWPTCNHCGEPWPCVEKVHAKRAEQVVDTELARIEVQQKFPHQCRRKVPGGSWRQIEGVVYAEREERCTRRFETERGRDQHERHHDRYRDYVVVDDSTAEQPVGDAGDCR